ncbi:MAG TPA: hypothetical protein VFE70_06685, partial [Candidatus Elarobacter sp.]|nr:hypothetical protein [Candidatus Elarobacter sp.]
MSAVARALVCGMALALIAGAQAPPASAQPRRDVRIAFETEDGLLRLEVFSAPGAFVVDPHALRFTLRAFRGF